MAYPDSFPNIQYSSGGDINLIPEVRRLLCEPVARDYTDTQIQSWLDQGASETARLSKAVEQGVAYITLSTGASEYPYPTALFQAPQEYSLEIEELFYCGQATSTPQKAQGGRALTKMDMVLVGNHPTTITAGPPQFWTIRHTANNVRYIYISPAPAAGQNAHVVEVLWYAAANILKVADSSTTHYLREHLRMVTIWYAVSEAHKKMRRYNEAAMYRGIWRNFVGFHRSDKHQKPVNSQAEMRIPDYTQYR